MGTGYSLANTIQYELTGGHRQFRETSVVSWFVQLLIL